MANQDPNYSGEEKATQKSFLMRNVRFLPFIIFVALAGIFLIRLGDRSLSSNVPSPLIGKMAPAAVLEPLIGLTRDGKQVQSFDAETFKGNLTLVNVFASWCAPCREEHPYLVELSKRDDLKVVGINYKDNAQNALRFLGVLGNPYDEVGVDPNGKNAIDWGVYGVPENFIVDKNGIIRYKHIGPIDKQSITKINAELEKAKQPLN